MKRNEFDDDRSSDSGLKLPPMPGFENTYLPAIAERMQSLMENLISNNRKLQATQAEYERKQAEADAIRSRVTSVAAKEQERLRLNIGGERFEIRSTSVAKNHYFKALMNGTFMPADPDGFYFIDRSPEWFPVIITALREGQVDLSGHSDMALSMIRKDAEYYMVQELIQEIDKQRISKRGGEGATVVNVNSSATISTTVPGLFFEMNIQRRNFKLHNVAFVAGERRTMVVEVFMKEGNLDAPGAFRKIGWIDTAVDRGQLVNISITPPLALGMKTYTFGIYSASLNAVAVCSRKEAMRDLNVITLGRSYCVRDLKAQFSKRSNEDEFDFCGDLGVSFA